MKRLCLLLAVFSSVATPCFAQSVTNSGTFSKPQCHDILWETGFAPNLTGSRVFKLPILAKGSDRVVVKGRRFIAEDKAAQGMANLSISNDGDATDFTYALGAGLEKHRSGKARLSPYYGYGAGMGYDSDSETVVDDSTMERKTTTESTFAISIEAFTGFDYSIIPDIYIGLELK